MISFEDINGNSYFVGDVIKFSWNQYKGIFGIILDITQNNSDGVIKVQEVDEDLKSKSLLFGFQIGCLPPMTLVQRGQKEVN
tara:strand:- start:235 stop:480 length:246 start_codon:yes stop_codon:yes gene_type:complete